MEKSDITLYLGGTSSGKSRRAEEHVQKEAEGPVLYVATAKKFPDDAAMMERIHRHCLRRPAHWATFECPLHLGKMLPPRLDALLSASFSSAAQKKDTLPTVLIDCVTMWITNILMEQENPGNMSPFLNAVRAETEALIALMQQKHCRWVLVSGETGLGGIAQNSLSRTFCDGLGLANQLLAEQADNAYLVVAGRLLKLS